MSPVHVWPHYDAADNRRATTCLSKRDARAIREHYGLSQEKFASLMGISVATLRNWEQGRRSPEGPAKVLLKVASKYPEAVLDVVRMRKTRKTA